MKAKDRVKCRNCDYYCETCEKLYQMQLEHILKSYKNQEKYKKIATLNNEKKPQEALCWCCKKATCGDDCDCEWALGREPVPGWVVKVHHHKAQAFGVNYDSYCVKSCPKFERG